MRFVYLLLAILGAAIPLSAFVPWVMEHGMQLDLMYSQILNDSLSLFAWLDVLIAAICLILFIFIDGQKHQVKHRYWAILLTCAIGVSCGLPFYLYLRSRQQLPPW